LLKDKVAILTGNSRSVNFEIATEIATQGAVVIVCSRSMASAQKSARTIIGEAHPERLDGTDAHYVSEFARHISESPKHIDVLINNAGYPFDPGVWIKRFHEVAKEDFDRVIEADLKGTLRLSLEMIRHMIRNGGSGGHN
jgi:NAD(P)-dependent dehydrogenase (short-subunit alcohol dehydrogenase family)